MSDEKYNYYLKSGIVGSLSQSVNIIADPLNLWLKVQILSPALFGTFVITQVIINIATEISALGLSNLVMHRVPKTILNDKYRARKIMGQVLLISLVSVSSVMFLIIISRNYIQSFFGEEQLSLWIYWLALLAPLSTIRDLHSQWLKATERMNEAFLIGGLIPNPISLLGLFIVWWFEYGIYGIIFVIFIERVTSLFPWLISENLFRNTNISTLRRTDFIYSLQLLGSRMTSLLNKNMDLLMLGWLGTSSMTAIYKVGSSFAGAIQSAKGLLGVIINPRISRFLENEEKQKLKNEFTVIQNLNMITALVFVAAILGFGRFFLSLLGSEYLNSEPVILILLIGQTIHLSAGSMGAIIRFTGRGGLALANSFLVISVNAIGNYVLIQLYGAIGAAIAWAIALILGKIIIYLEVYYWEDLNLMPLDIILTDLLISLILLYTFYNSHLSLWLILPLIPPLLWFVYKNRIKMKNVLRIAWDQLNFSKS